MARKRNLLGDLQEMLEYIFSEGLHQDGKDFLISDDRIKKDPLIIRTLEEIGCLEYLGRVSIETQDRHGKRHGICFVQDLCDKIKWQGKKSIKRPWGRSLWLVKKTRIDEVNPELVLSQPLLEVVQRTYGKPQIRAVDEDEQNSGHPPWRAGP